MSRKHHKHIVRREGQVVKEVFVPEGKVAFTLLPANAGSKPTPSPYSDQEVDDEIQKWGDDNLWPTHAREKIEKSTTAYPLIARMVGMMYGKGLTYWREVREGNQIKYDFSLIPEVDEFLLNNDIQYLMLERLMDYKFFGNIFAEFILSNDRKQITNIFHKEAEFSRFGTIDKSAFRIKNLMYAGNWDESPEPAPIPFLNRRDKNKAYIQKTFKENKFAIHSCLPSPGRSLYARPPHSGIFEKDGWLDFANSIPVLMNKVNQDAFDIKYHIQVPYEYWGRTVKEWDSLDQDKREEIIDTKLSEMADFLKDNKETAFITHYATDEITGKKTSGWEITVLDDKSKKDKYLTSVQEADTQVARAIGVDMSMAGIQSQISSNGAGSGSDKRVGYTNMIALSHADTLQITEPLRLVQYYNDWDKDIRFGFIHDFPTTLNDNSDGVEQNKVE